MPANHPGRDQANDRSDLSPELLDVQNVAKLCQFSARHVLRMADAGQMPPPVKVGRCVRWSRRSIEKWIESGCPKGSRS